MTAFERETSDATAQGVEMLAILRELNQQRAAPAVVDDALNNISDMRDLLVGLPDLVRIFTRRLEEHTEAIRDNTAAMRLVLAMLPAEQQEQARALQREQRQAARSIERWANAGD